MLEVNDATASQAKEGYPHLTKVTPQLKRHVGALLALFSTEAPLVLPMHPTDAQKISTVHNRGCIR